MTDAVVAKSLVKELRHSDREGAPLSILRGLQLAVAAGETVAIVGASGYGKTTLL